MNVMLHIRETISQEVFDFQTLSNSLREYRKPRDKIRALLAAGDIIRVKKGLYVFATPYRRHAYSRELLANLVYGPSYVSLDYALAYYGMIPERVDTITSVTTGKKKEFNTPAGRFTYSLMSVDRYSCGIDLIELQDDQAFLIATREKALIDKVWSDRRFQRSSLAVTRTYLTEDLRIEEDQLRGLDRNAIRQVSVRFNSAKIACVAGCIEKIQDRRL